MAEERDDKKRGRTWEKEETIILLEKWGEENIQLRLKECKRKKPIWQEISNFLNASGYNDRDCDSCKTRIHTLISAYRSYKDALSRSGNATPKKKSPFFDEIDEILSDKPATKPVMVISSTTLASAENEQVDGSTEDVDLELLETNEGPSCSYPAMEKENRPKDKKSLPGRFVFFLLRNFSRVFHSHKSHVKLLKTRWRAVLTSARSVVFI